MRRLRVAIIDPSYRKSEFLGLGASWLLWELTSRHAARVEVVSPGEADVVLASVQSQQVVDDLRRAIRRYGVRAPVIIGGPGAMAPVVFGQRGLVRGACVGEGRGFVDTLAQHGVEAALDRSDAWVPARRGVTPSVEFPWDTPPVRGQDGTVRVWWSRGCRRRCLFCQTGWESIYRQTPTPERQAAIARQLVNSSERVVMVTNDHSDVSGAVSGDEHGSVTVDGLRKLWGTGQPTPTRHVRLGVEGISERLRRAVHKPIATSDLIDVTLRLLGEGCGVVWFLIVGLPGETAADWDEWRSTVYEIKRRATKGVVRTVFHAFLPHPAAPLSAFPLVDEYWERFEEFRRWFFDGPGATARVQIIAPARYQRRMSDACLNMASTEQDLRRGWLEGRIASPNRIAVEYPHDTLFWKAAEQYAMTLGLPLPGPRERTADADRAPDSAAARRGADAGRRREPGRHGRGARHPDEHDQEPAARRSDGAGGARTRPWVAVRDA